MRVTAISASMVAGTRSTLSGKASPDLGECHALGDIGPQGDSSRPGLREDFLIHFGGNRIEGRKSRRQGMLYRVGPIEFPDSAPKVRVIPAKFGCATTSVTESEPIGCPVALLGATAQTEKPPNADREPSREHNHANYDLLDAARQSALDSINRCLDGQSNEQ
jgi:hypothetical protein